MAFKFVAEKGVGAQLRAAFSAVEIAASPSMYVEIEMAATGAIRDAANLLKTEGRANIASAGFSKKWQNAWRVNVYPATGFSIEAAAYAWHNIPYSLVFETGQTIRARAGKLWLPLDTVPKQGRRRASAKQLAGRGVNMFTISRPGKNPLLATKLRGADGAFRNSRAISLSKLRRGAQGKRGIVQSVPLFVGVDSVTIRKRFDLEGVRMRVEARLGELYYSNLKA